MTPSSDDAGATSAVGALMTISIGAGRAWISEPFDVRSVTLSALPPTMEPPATEPVTGARSLWISFAPEGSVDGVHMICSLPVDVVSAPAVPGRTFSAV